MTRLPDNQMNGKKLDYFLCHLFIIPLVIRSSGHPVIAHV